MKTRIFKIVALTFFVLSANAAGHGEGIILPDWNVYGDGNVFFYLSGAHIDSPCSVIPERWAFDTTTPVGRSFFSAFLMAYASGKTVYLHGSGDCIHGNTEAVYDFRVR